MPRKWVWKEGQGFRCRWTSSLSKTIGYEDPNPNWQQFDVLHIHDRFGTVLEFSLSSISLFLLFSDSFDQAQRFLDDWTDSQKKDQSVTLTDVETESPSLPSKRMRKRNLKFSGKGEINLEPSSDKTFNSFIWA
mgnify:CR=1 FL=1